MAQMKIIFECLAHTFFSHFSDWFSAWFFAISGTARVNNEFYLQIPFDLPMIFDFQRTSQTMRTASDVNKYHSCLRSVFGFYTRALSLEVD